MYERLRFGDVAAERQLDARLRRIRGTQKEDSFKVLVLYWKGDPIGCSMSPSKVERKPRKPRTLIGAE